MHIATEGPIGIAMRKFCLAENLSFTTAYHTRFPEYVHARTRIPTGIAYAWLRHFHAPSMAVSGGDRTPYRTIFAARICEPRPRGRAASIPRCFGPVRRYPTLGRARCSCTWAASRWKRHRCVPGARPASTKSSVGDGPQRAALQQRHPHAAFTGAHSGRGAGRAFSSADVFVFPSRTDTFGLVMLEAMASGTPVAAYPVPGPLRRDLARAKAEYSPRICAPPRWRRAISTATSVRRHALAYSWERATAQFITHLHPNHARDRARLKARHWGQRGSASSRQRAVLLRCPAFPSRVPSRAFRQEVALAAILVPIACLRRRIGGGARSC